MTREPIIRPNGSEYLVLMNGSVFLALTRPEAESLERRMRGQARPAKPVASSAPPPDARGVVRG